MTVGNGEAMPTRSSCVASVGPLTAALFGRAFMECDVVAAMFAAEAEAWLEPLSRLTLGDVR